MKREIKLRWYDRRNHRMIYDLLTEVFPDGSMLTERDSEWTIFAGQSTGLKDTNGKEIYEGDIVENHNKDYRQVLYTHCGFEMRMMNGYREKGNTIWYYDVEIIGNIHENKDLLK